MSRVADTKIDISITPVPLVIGRALSFGRREAGSLLRIVARLFALALAPSRPHFALLLGHPPLLPRQAVHPLQAMKTGLAAALVA